MQSSAHQHLKMMSLNLWRGGEAAHADPETSRRCTLRVLEAVDADVIGLQETNVGTARYAEQLGLFYVDQGGGRGIMSRLDVLAETPDHLGVTIRLRSGRVGHVFNVHLRPRPYQPYQLAAIPFEDGPTVGNAAEAIAEARKARGEETSALLAALRPVIAGREPVFLAGGFNEPSHLDWTARAAGAGLCQLEVAWPLSSALAAAGMRDAFRSVSPDEVRRRGDTWTPRPASREIFDRIDRIYFAGAGVAPVSAVIVGETAARADVVITPWPSDHRALVVTFALGHT